MLSNSTLEAETGRNTCLDIRVTLNTDCDGDVSTLYPKNSLIKIDRHKRISQLNIDSPLEVNLEIESEPKVMFVVAKLKRDLKKMITMLHEFEDVFTWS